MSVENVRLFYGQLINDKTLHDEVKQMDVEHRLSEQQIVELAAQRGFAFSVAELKEAQEQAARSPDALLFLTKNRSCKLWQPGCFQGCHYL